MPNHWEGIEDSSAQSTPVWLTRSKPEDPFTPLRKCDCKALNASTNGQPVYVEGGRATADPVQGTLSYNFYARHAGTQRELVSAIWFRREKLSGDEVLLTPVTDSYDSNQMERMYQAAVEATSSLGKGIASVLDQEEILQDGESKVMVAKTGNTLTMKQVPTKGWFASPTQLQRGYGEYEVPGEDNELALGPVRQVAFVIHGIGEALFSREEINVSSLMDQTNATRRAIHKKQVDEWSKQCEKARKAGQPEPPPPGKIELLPIEWFDQLHDSSSSLMKSLRGCTLPTIPALRSIANDVVFDVLMYLTPAFCESVLECVTTQINDLFAKFQVVHPDFLDAGGKCSLIGHSLGSVIAWDLLSILKDFREPQRRDGEKTAGMDMSGVSIESEDSVTVGYQMYAREEHANQAQNGTWGPSLTKRISQPIPFVPDCTIFLGSPLGLFLTLRGAHPVFDEMRKAADEPLCSPFSLPTASLYNIFHPSDPVAYRIEPLLLSQDTEPSDVPPPVYFSPPGKELRLHFKAKQLGEKLLDNLSEQKKGWNSLLESAVSVMSSEAAAHKAKEEPRHDPLIFRLGGRNQRVDYSLQTGVIENEYISAVTAHSSYFNSPDVQELLLSLVVRENESVEQE